MIKVKSIGNNARIVGGSQCCNKYELWQFIYYISDCGSFYQESWVQTGAKIEIYWVMKPDGTVPTEQDAIREGLL